jgi:serine/threonine protein kinase
MADPSRSAEELFGEALELTPAARSAFLDQVCAHDPELRRRIEELLLKDERAGSFLKVPLFTPDATGTVSALHPAPVGRFQAGQLIACRFMIVRFIARGGMGEVYEAKDQFLQEAGVALKIIRPEIAGDATTSTRFEQEVLLARKVVHANLCPIYEIFRCDAPAPPFLFLTMRLLQGETLYARFERSQKLEPGETVAICKQLLAGVAALHAGGVIHRDLKPNNVMLETGGSGLRVSIMDFGLARPNEAANTLFASGVIAGTPGYMAPELLHGERPTQATDLFALGAVLHQVLSGERPLAAGHSLAPSPALRASRAPAEWARAVEDFLSSDPKTRTRAFERVWLGQSGGPTSRASLIGPGRALRYAAAAAIAVVLVVILVTLKMPSRFAGPLESTQITSSAEPKEGPLFTDGARLYFDSRGIPSEMAVGGGPIVPMQILERGMILADISADGAKALGLKQGEDTMGRGTLWTTAMLGGTPRRLSDHLAKTARWSPDGRSIIFTDLQTLYRIGAEGDNLVRVWEAPAEISDLAISPDGRQLSVTVGDSPDIRRLWSVSADGQNAHPLQFAWPADAGQSAGQWTPDGRHFLFRSGREGRENVYELVKARWFEFWKKPAPVRLSANQLTVLASAPSRDSRGLFALSRMEQGTMRAYDPRSKRLTPILDDVSMLQFVISPDRQWMAYTDYPNRNLWKSRLDGSEKLQLTHSYSVMEQWSPDGKWLVYSDWKNLYLVSSDGGAPETLPRDGDSPIAPTWSSDGKTIAFSYFPVPDKLPRIEMIDVARRRIYPMPNGAGYYYPSWSPDGKYLVAMAENPARMALYSSETKSWKDLRLFPDPWGFWSWARDSKSLYMAVFLGKASDGLYRMSIPRGDWEKFVDVTGINPGTSIEEFVSLTRDGQPAVMSLTGPAQVYLLHW